MHGLLESLGNKRETAGEQPSWQLKHASFSKKERGGGNSGELHRKETTTCDVKASVLTRECCLPRKEGVTKRVGTSAPDDSREKRKERGRAGREGWREK